MKKSVYVLYILMLMMMLPACENHAEKNANLAEAAYQMGNAYFTEGDLTSALKELMKAYKYNPTSYDINHLLGLAYLSKRDLNMAAKHIRQAITLSEDNSKARHHLGIVYLEMEKYDNAIDQFKLASEDILYDTPAMAYTHMGWAYYKKGAYIEAERIYKKAIDKEPRYYIAYQDLAILYYDLKKYDKAIKQYKKAIKFYPKYIDAWYNLAQTYFKTDNKEDAATAFNKVIEIAPNSKKAENARGYLELLK